MNHLNLADSFAALRGRTRMMPIALRERAIRNLGGDQTVGLEFAKAHLLSTRAQVGLWVVPGKETLCIFEAQHAASTCASYHYAANHGLELVVGVGRTTIKEVPEHFLALGLEPDRVRAVELAEAGRPEVALLVPIRANVFGIRLGYPAFIARRIPR